MDHSSLQEESLAPWLTIIKLNCLLYRDYCYLLFIICLLLFEIVCVKIGYQSTCGVYNVYWVGVAFSYECGVVTADNSTCIVCVYGVAVKAVE